MDVLIPNLNLPKGDEVINLSIDQYGNVLKHERIGFRKYQAIALPEHGRLIDADALLPKSGYDPMMFKHKYDGDHRTQYDTLMGYEILGIVEDAPTVLEASNG